MRESRRHTRGVAPPLLWSLLFAVVSFPTRSARADGTPTLDPLDLEWEGPDQCPGRETVLEQIRRILGEAPIPVAPARVSARVSVSRSDENHWHVHIEALDGSGGERAFESLTCSALTSAVALVLAIRIRPTLTSSGVELASSPPPPAPPVAPSLAIDAPEDAAARTPELAPANAGGQTVTSREPPRVQERAGHDVLAGSPRRPGSFAVGVAAVATLGELPSADASAELDAAYTVGGFRVEVHGETGLVQRVPVSSALPGATTSFRAAGGGARGCYGPALGAVRLLGCLDAELDAIWAVGQGFTQPLAPNGVWFTVGALLGARWPLTRRFGVRVFAEALAPFEEAKFVTEGLENVVVHRVSAAWGRAGLGLDAIFF